MAGAEGSCASRRKGPALPDVPAASPSPSALLSDPRGPDAQTRLPPAAPASQTPLDAAVPVGWPRQNRHEGKGVSGRRGRRPLVPRRARAGRARRAEPRPSSRAMPSARWRGGARGGPGRPWRPGLGGRPVTGLPSCGQGAVSLTQATRAPLGPLETWARRSAPSCRPPARAPAALPGIPQPPLQAGLQRAARATAHGPPRAWPGRPQRLRTGRHSPVLITSLCSENRKTQAVHRLATTDGIAGCGGHGALGDARRGVRVSPRRTRRGPSARHCWGDATCPSAGRGPPRTPRKEGASRKDGVAPSAPRDRQALPAAAALNPSRRRLLERRAPAHRRACAAPVQLEVPVRPEGGPRV